MARSSPCAPSRALLVAAVMAFGRAMAQDAPPLDPAPGNALPQGAVSRLLGSPGTHSDRVVGVTISPDGKLAASISNDSTIKIWKWPSLEPVASHRSSCPGDATIGFDADSRRLLVAAEIGGLVIGTRPFAEFASCERDRSQARWNSGFAGTATRELVRTVADFRIVDPEKQSVICIVEFPSESLESAQVSSATSDLRWIAIGDLQGRVRVFDGESGKQKASIDVADGKCTTLELSPDGNRLLTGDRTGSAQVWDISTGRKFGEFKPDYGFGRSVAWSPDGKRIATSRLEGGIHLWDPDTALRTAEFTTDSRIDVTCIAFASDSSTILAGSHEGRLFAWDISTGKSLIPPPPGHSGELNGAVFSPDGSRLATCGDDGVIVIWEAATGGVLEKMKPSAVALRAIAWPPDSDVPVVVTRDRKILRRTDAGWKPVDLGEGKFDLMMGCVISGDASVVVLTSLKGDVLVADGATGHSAFFLKGDGNGLRVVAPCTRWNLLAIGPREGNVDLRSLSDGRPRSLIPGDDALDVAISPDGTLLARTDSHGMGGRVRVFDLSTGRDRCSLVLEDTPDALAWCDEGRALALLDRDGTLVFCDASVGRETRRFDGDAVRFPIMVASSDGQLLATIAEKGPGTIWRVPDGASLPPDLEFKTEGVWKTLISGTPEDIALMTARAHLSDEIVRHLGERLQERPEPPEGLADLVAQLDDADAQKRDAAVRALVDIGVVAEPRLRESLKGGLSAEADGRLRDILASMESLPIRSPAMLPRWRALNMLHRAGTAEARKLLARVEAESPYTIERIAAQTGNRAQK
ncbi:MAG: WD40 repeat domain-containing protein [Planctomycetes bacterium]|nr:WD40 repeat domain-containing protein [Planctomycetota bacterium]